MKKLLVTALILILVNYAPLGFAFEDINTLSEKVIITKSQLPLNSKFKNKYNAYKYDITNKSNHDISIVNSQIINGLDGSIAFYTISNDNTGLGYVWAICGPAGFYSFGIAWAAGLLATPIVWLVSSSKNKKARVEGMAYSNIVNLYQLEKGKSTTIQTLVPIGAQPQLILTIQDQSSKSLIVIHR